MTDPPRLRDLPGAEHELTRALLRDAAPTKALSAVESARLAVHVAKATAHAGGWFATAAVPKALAALTLVAVTSGVAVVATHPRPSRSPRAHVTATSERRPGVSARVLLPSPTEPPTPVASPEEPPSEVTPSPAGSLAPEPLRVASRAPRPRPQAATKPTLPSAPSRRTPTLGDELSAVDSARGALRSDPARALATLRDYEQTFDGGQLRDERDALRVEALVNLGRWNEASSLASALEARAPRSAQSARVRALLSARPEP